MQGGVVLLLPRLLQNVSTPTTICCSYWEQHIYTSNPETSLDNLNLANKNPT